MFCLSFAVSRSIAVGPAAGRIPDLGTERHHQHSAARCASVRTINRKSDRSRSHSDIRNMGTRSISEWTDFVVCVADQGLATKPLRV